MSQTFDVYPAENGLIKLTSIKGGERFTVAKMGYVGPNRLVTPSFVNIDQEPLNSCNAKFSEAASLATKDDRTLLGFHPTYMSRDIGVVKSQVGGYLEANSYSSRHSEHVILEAQHLTKTNKAHYYFKLLGQCPKMDEIVVRLADGTTINFNGEIEMYSYDKDILALQVQLPPNSRIRASFAQIIPKKDSILKMLSRIQYGQNSFQPKGV
jgi:hypothetical protein